MTKSAPVVRAASQVLAHLPGMARYGSKPARELPRSPEVEEKFLASLRSFEEAVAYAPHQAWIGRVHPRDMPERPWVGATLDGAARSGPDGEIMPEEEFVGLMAAVDEFELITIDKDLAARARKALADHPSAARIPLERLEAATGDVEAVMAQEGSLQIFAGGSPSAALRRAHEEDESLTAGVLLENLACKASATLALLHLLDARGIDPLSIDYVLSCSEEAVGERYQRGGGNMAKAVASSAGLARASGADVKNFCAAPIPALVFAASLVHSKVFRRVAVVAGGSVPKLGMKFQGHLRHDLPVMEDVIGGTAILVEMGAVGEPVIRLDVVGHHPVSAGGANPQIMEALAMEPLHRAGLTTRDVDEFGTELHNPEVTEPQGSGNVPERNYKTLAALAVRARELSRQDIDRFVAEQGMPGFAPTQGHLASAVCYLPWALRRLNDGTVTRVQMIAKGSLFLGRMCQLSDGMSILLEAAH